jgi:hypothetical protein
MEIRLFRSILPLDHDHLTVAWHLQSQAPDERREALPARRLTDLTLQLRALRPEVRPLPLELLHSLRL